MFQAKLKGDWVDMASFDLAHVCEADLAMRNYYASTNKSLIYSQHRIATLNRPDGRVSLADRKLRELSGGKSKVMELEEGQSYLDALAEVFGITLDAPYDALGEIDR